jgi:hypothetical protein
MVQVIEESPCVAQFVLRDHNGEPLVIDGPFAETKEQLLGLYVVECASMDEALEIARSLPVLNTSFEVRPVRRYIPGVGLPGVDEEKPAVT